MNNLLYVFIGGGIGSAARYGLALLTPKIFTGTFPLATLIANILSCLLLIVTANVFINKPDSALRLLIITGFCGGFSTFSTFSFETVELMKNGHISIAIANIAVSMIACTGIVYLLSKTA